MKRETFTNMEMDLGTPHNVSSIMKSESNIGAYVSNLAITKWDCMNNENNLYLK